MSKKIIRWVLAHEPIELFLRAGRRFSDEIYAKTNGDVEIEIMTVSEYSAKYNGGKPVNRLELLDLMNAGKIEMSQMYTTSLAKFEKDMSALDLPFLFRNHDHASKVLDGPIGKDLFSKLAQKSNIQGLAFTYSGGFRMIAGTKPIQKIEDFKGLKIRTAHSPVAEATFRAVGAEPVPMNLEDLNEEIGSGNLHGGESTYPRFFSMKQNEVSTVVSDTQHSLFLTSILVNSKFWNSLNEDLRQIMQNSAQVAAIQERKESIDDISNVQNQCKEAGISIVTLPEAEKNQFKSATAKVYEQFEPIFSSGLVKKIIAS